MQSATCVFGFIVAGNEPTSCEPPEPLQLQGTKAAKQPLPTTKDHCSPHVHVVGQLFCVMVVLQFIPHHVKTIMFGVYYI
jgi:hypothetical protein